MSWRPRVAFAMQDQVLLKQLLPAKFRTRLLRSADCDFNTVITDFDDVADTELKDIDVLLTGWGCPAIDEKVLARMPKLQLIAHAAGSVKGYVSQACWERGITVTTAAHANAIPVADYTLACILMAGKASLTAQAMYREFRGTVDREAHFPHVGNYRRTVGIISASTIGRLVLERLRAFDFEILLYDPTIGVEGAALLGARKVELGELLAASDLVSLHAPVLPETLGMLGRAELALLPDGATVINTARGLLIDTNALRTELQSGRINAYLDVTEPEPLPVDDPLFTLPNVMLTPHIAGSLGNELHRLGDYAITEIEHWATGAAPKFPVLQSQLARMA